MAFLNCLPSKGGIICGLKRPTDPLYHQITLPEIEENLKTSLIKGLTSVQARELLNSNGPNKITPHQDNKFFKLISYLFTGFCGILWIAGIICILAWKPIGDPPDPTNLGLGLLLILVIFLQACFSAFQDWSSDKLMSTIKKMIPQKAHVTRDGIDKFIPGEELVIGDIVNLTYGKKVPADVRIIESNDLKFDKSMLTGESEPVEGFVHSDAKAFNEAKNIGFMTSLITNGSGKGVVIYTGDETMIGKITKMTSINKNKKTSLQKDINRFVFYISCMAIVTNIVVFIVWIAALNIKYYGFLNVSGILVNLISVAVAFIPEGLPVAVTLVLLIMAKRMARSKVLVKNLTTLETLSAVNVICSDKTGTLTKNLMHVAQVLVGTEAYFSETFHNVHHLHSENFILMPRAENKYIVHEINFGDDKDLPSINQMLALSNLCNNAKYDPITKEIQGDATDKALMNFSVSHNTSKFKENYSIIIEIPFNSRNKWMMKLIKPIDGSVHQTFFGEEYKNNEYIMFMKGAPDILLKKCMYYIPKKGGSEIFLDPKTTDFIKHTQKEWSSSGQRVLIFLKKYIKVEEAIALSHMESIDLEKAVAGINGFTFVGMTGIIDPPRDDIHDVMDKCKKAGIKVLMVTGDHGLTAAAIGRQVGIFSTKHPDKLKNVRKMEEIVPEKFKLMDLESIKSSFIIENEKKKELNFNETQRKPHELKVGQLNSLLLSGSDLDYLTADDWLFVTKYDEIVFARTSPEQKLKVVSEFQKYGFIVAVTGDGVNDAPSLKKANIGIAMGSGSDVAMEAAEVVFLDSNFSSILIAIKNGRLIFQNLRKVIIYLLPAGSFAEIIPVLINTFLGVPQTMSSFQMIIICIFTDVFPSLAMMLEKEVFFIIKKLNFFVLGKRFNDISS